MAEDDEDEDEDVLFQDDEDHAEEAALRAWMRLQQQAARQTWGIKGDAATLAEYRRQQVQRWEQAQHVLDDEMLDRAFSQHLTRLSSSFEGLFFGPTADSHQASQVSSVKRGGVESPSRPARVRPVRTHGWMDV